MSFDYHIPTKSPFRSRKAESTGRRTVTGKKALIVMSNGTSMRKYGYLDRLQSLLTQQHVETEPCRLSPSQPLPAPERKPIPGR